MALPAAMPSSFSNLHHHTGHYSLQDGMEYDQESINQNWAQLIISITYMARAHDESETKSKRISAVWENKRSKAGNGGEKLTAKAPAWLKLSQDRTKFILIPEAAKAIELIFRKKLAGKGAERIARELNDDPYPLYNFS